ncbi:MAG TPA: TonB-dependent receptor [Bryobacteraceae bacterium]|nr:TonB-dependent receptor [Bryobacteraceae bacterium]
MGSISIYSRVAFAIFAFAFFAPAQSVDGTLTGIVSDPSGAVVPASTVTAFNQATRVQYTANTTAEGEYRMDHVPVGVYEVRATKPGFAPLPISNVVVALNRITTVNLDLLVAGSIGRLTVEANAPIDEATAQLQTNFNTESLIDIPVAANGSGFINLSLLSAGVASPGGLGLGAGPSVGGQRPTSNRFYVEGADNNSYFSPSPLGYISNEAIEEFTLLQNHFGPEFGWGPGGIFNAVVKTGGNDLHGSAYEYNQNRDLNALDAQYARQGLTSPPRFDSNRLGATTGGPIRKNSLFYFGNFEYNPIGFAFSPAQTVSAPTAAGYSVLNSLPGLSKNNLQVFEQYVPVAPQAAGQVTVAGTSIPVGPLAITAPSYANWYRGVGSMDWDANDQDRVRGRYMYSRYSGIDTTATFPAFFVTQPSDTHLVSLSEYHSFSPTTQNELRLGYSHSNTRRTASNFTFPGLDAFPTIAFDELALQLGPNPNVPQGTVQGSLQATDMVTRVMGRHALKAGYEFNDIIMTTSFVSYPRGYYIYQTLDRYLEDMSPDFFGARWLGTTGPLVAGMPAGFLQNAAYFNDDFRVRPNLTLNLGVRYEYVTVPVMSRMQQFSAPANVPGVIAFNEPQPTKDDWSPRVGFAYSPGTGGVWSIRGGFSRAFDVPFANSASNTAPAFYGSQASVNVNAASPNFLGGGGLTGASDALSSVAAARAAISGYTPDQARPYAINYTLAVERRMGRDYSVEARYLGSRGDHLLVQEQLNRNAVVTPARFIPTFLTAPTAAQLAPLTLTTGTLKAISNNPWAAYGFGNPITDYAPRGNSQYHGLALQATRRYSRNLSFIAAYTWSHLMDDSTATVNSTLLTPRRPQDFNNIAADWGISMLDRRQRFTFSPVIDVNPIRARSWMLRNVAGNWNVAFTYIYESPEYATVQSGVDSNLNGDSISDRAIVNPTGTATVGSGVYGIDVTGAKVSLSSPNIVAYVAKNPNARYVAAGVGAISDGGRNTFPLDPINNFDASLRKRLAFRERLNLEIGVEFFNLLNHPQFTGGYPNDVLQERNTNRNFLIPSNSLFGQYQQFFPSNARYGQVLARFTF